MTDTNVSVLVTTVANEQDAKTLSTQLLEANLAACIQESSIKSHYRWEGEMQCEPEIFLLIKTSAARVSEAIAFIEKHHAYDCPEIIALPVVDGSHAYLNWVLEETA